MSGHEEDDDNSGSSDSGSPMPSRSRAKASSSGRSGSTKKNGGRPKKDATTPNPTFDMAAIVSQTIGAVTAALRPKQEVSRDNESKTEKTNEGWKTKYEGLLLQNAAEA